MPQFIYEACSEFLIALLTYIFKLIIAASQMPQDWTVSSVTPIPKVGNADNIIDFRPITKLPTPNKIFEKVLFLKFTLVAIVTYLKNMDS